MRVPWDESPLVNRSHWLLSGGGSSLWGKSNHSFLSWWRTPSWILYFLMVNPLSILFSLTKFSISLWKSLTTTPLLVLWGVSSSCTCLDVLCTEFRSGKLDMRACGKVSMLPSTLVLKCGIFLSYLSSSLSSLSSFLSPLLVFSFLALPRF